MFDIDLDALHDESRELFLLLRCFVSRDKPFLLRTDLWDELQTFCADPSIGSLEGTAVEHLIRQAQEAAVDAPWVCLAVRVGIGRWCYLRFHLDSGGIHEIEIEEFLKFKERLVLQREDEFALGLDLGPFEREFPALTEDRSIGRGVEFLNRRLSSRLFDDGREGLEGLVKFLRVHEVGGRQLLLGGQLHTGEDLRKALRAALDLLANEEDAAEWSTVADRMERLGFLAGWGRTVARVGETLELLSEILEAPEPKALERFLGRLPMIFNVVTLSPHGYFGQSGVLGLPDTGGQVVYVLDQVRALEKEMRRRIHEQGLDIEPRILVVTRLLHECPPGTGCDQRLEAIAGTENSHILRVPFRTPEGEIVPDWISRFEIWPYLERFTQEVEKEVAAELDSRPDLIIGNYSDGNLVATLLARRLEVTQCTIAHALEKSKYPLSDLYWHDSEEEYHFSVQITADLISMASADFIIASTYQEIAGRDDSAGQYESFSSFTLPGLYRVIRGIDVFDPKFNIISPGADAGIYFPRSEEERRLPSLHDEIGKLVWGDDGAEARGVLSEPEKPLLFSMARLDRVKNLTGLVSWYAESERLQEEANLLIIAGAVRPEDSTDREEQGEIERMHELFDRHGLDDRVRWVGKRLDKQLAGELYRWVADRPGAFVQPALFEAFGLTVIEAMISGLPTFATLYGGPLEIIEDGRSGFHIDPNHGDRAAERMADFWQRCREEPEYWKEISEGGIDRVRARYTWDLHAERLMTLSRVYGFWKFVTNLERQETRRYLEMFYSLQYRPRAATVGQRGRDGDAGE